MHSKLLDLECQNLYHIVKVVVILIVIAKDQVHFGCRSQ